MIGKCLDVYDTEFKLQDENGNVGLESNRLYVKAMCRNDKKILKYELNVDLWGKVLPQPQSSIEDASVGRVFVNLAKAEQPSRWKKLFADNQMRPQNSQIWWELWDKYEKELEKHSPDSDGEDDDDPEINDEQQPVASFNLDANPDITEEDIERFAVDPEGGKKKKKKKKQSKVKSRIIDLLLFHLYRKNQKVRSSRRALSLRVLGIIHCHGFDRHHPLGIELDIKS